MLSQDVPQHFKKSCYVGNGVFSKEECSDLLRKMKGDDEALQIDTLQEGVRRVVLRTSLQDPELASYLYTKVAPICPETWKVEESDSNDGHMGPFSKGEWRIDGVDHRIQLYKYYKGGVFSKHRDGPTYYSGSHRSLFTVMVYLTDGFTGGNTTVFSDDLSLSYSVPSSLGSCFVMLQRTLHEGSMVQEGIKCALRCDVLYKRVVEEGMDTRKAEEEIVKGMEKKEQAKEWFRLASAVELSGRSNDSIVYYQKAYRLNPLLDEG